MKAYLLVIALCVGAVTTVSAQTEKGSKLVGAQVGNLTFPTSGGGGSIIGLQPAIGWFVGNNLAVGVGVPFFSVGASGTRVTQIGITPFARYYIGPSNVKPFLGASVGVINTSLSGRGTGNADPSTNGIYSVSGGLAFFINQSVSFDLGLTYTGGETVAVNSLLGGGLNSLTPAIPESINFNLGFQVYFGKK
ncbi:hypothetical protein [Spirosoma montaniterrae]|uniref:Outer membrane protein beta-barrel domain-containing protein n=1 Tax=Spirosoma montaniterrae TaxID=1178516 RepID=A0A1P9WXM6_9BACT|nr:hypothetical protein [Spirosoma montaniterrae]AQG80110.1 hypothetical protein AWR27_12700 [Spirosoma montaniterrae]